MMCIGSFDLEKKAAIVAVISQKPLETSKKAAEMGADILEIRLDLLEIRDFKQAVKLLNAIKNEVELPLIITNRSRNEGGKWRGREEERISLLINLLSLENITDAVDIELSAEKKDRDKVLKAAKEAEKKVIISSHNFSKTPSFQEMEVILEKAFLEGADIAKLAVMPQAAKDVLDLLKLSLQFRETGKTICTIAMGRLGAHTRVIAPFYGSALTYASVKSTTVTAPGQLPVNELKKMMELLE